MQNELANTNFIEPEIKHRIRKPRRRSQKRVAFTKGILFPAPRFSWTTAQPKMIYPKMSEYKTQEALLQQIGEPCGWSLAMCRQYKEVEFVHELAQANITGFFPYHTEVRKTSKNCIKLGCPDPTYTREEPMLYGYCFIKQDRNYDEDRLKAIGRFSGIVKVYTGECVGQYKNGKKIWEALRLPLTISSDEVLRLAVESAMYAPDKKLIEFVPLHNMEVKLKPEYTALSNVVAMAAEQQKVMVVKFNHKTKLTDVMIGKMQATIHAKFLVPA